MKASELRMGNLVLCNTSIGFVNTIVSVCNLSSDEIVCSYKPTKQFIFCKDALFEPIPLTEEWLLKFGFKKGEGGYIDRTFFLNGVICVFIINSSFNFYYKNILLKSVHQLQNLYFALTGEELTIKD